MADRGKVIKAVEEAFDLVHSDFIGTDDFNETEWKQNKADALAMLEEQDAQSVLSNRVCEAEPFRYVRKGFCPKCHQEMEWLFNRKYCGFCGQELKWE